ncbi:MAG: hypothetical protein JOZ69_22610 [Myxococcales bacterium]|nr:hypothetical protein [Myxococcales bacterium]
MTETDPALPLATARSLTAGPDGVAAQPASAEPYRPAAERARRAAIVALYALVAVGCAVRIAHVFRHNPIDHLFSDPARHWTHAKETLAPGPWAVIDPPLYQVWLSIVQKWSLGIPLLVGAIHAALSVVTPWLWYRFFRETLASRTLALAGWAAIAWLPSWIGIYDYFMTETLLLPLLGASLWQTARAMRLRSVPAFSGMVALWLLTTLTRAIAAPFAALLAIWTWVGLPRRTAAAGWATLIVVAVTLPLAVRNQDMVGLWSPLGTGWPNQIYAASGKGSMEVHLTRDGANWVYGFGSPSMNTKPLAPVSDWEAVRPGSVVVHADLRKGAEDWRAAYEQTAATGWACLRLRLENFAFVMLGTSWPDNNEEDTVAAIANAMRWLWLPLTAAVLAAMAWRRDITRSRPLVPLVLLVWFVFQAFSLVAVNEGRYRKPLEGLLIAEVLVLLDAAPRLTRRRRTLPSL